jgi:uncharacterized protein YhbP (UPF0306 family)
LDNKKILLEFLNSQHLMVLATSSDKPWSAIVYYAVDKQFNFYFLSEPTTEHCKIIAKNPFVACSVYNSSQKVTDKKIGVQLSGKAEKVQGIKTLKLAVTMWNKLNPGLKKFVNVKSITRNKIHSKFYKIEPIKIKFFNEELYGEEGFEIIDTF